MTTLDLDAADEHSTRNRLEVLASERCGCFCCGAIFAPDAIWNWLDTTDPHTAFCPQCGINAVLGDASGLPITLDFLREMNVRWFDEGTLWEPHDAAEATP
ncbi:MAG: cytoplasmic protein [Chloroflexi bacterium]|nr:MAG: cytoplasmic protein [Chloroflexota bacterium]